MKTSLLLAVAASLLLCGCSVFQRSPTWESVVDSRTQYSGSGVEGAKDSYLNHLHQVLTSAGVEHKFVEYQYHYYNVYREASVESATAILYRDATTPSHPWWIMDEYHHVPVWLPNWELKAQLEFFAKHKCDVVAVKDFAGHADAKQQVARVEKSSPRAFAHTAQEKKFRALFTGNAKPATAPKAPRKRVAAITAVPPPAKARTERTVAATEPSDSRAVALFRTTHGSTFDPGSSVDRAKMNELRRSLLNRGQRISLRTQ